MKQKLTELKEEKDYQNNRDFNIPLSITDRATTENINKEREY